MMGASPIFRSARPNLCRSRQRVATVRKGGRLKGCGLGIQISPKLRPSPSGRAKKGNGMRCVRCGGKTQIKDSRDVANFTRRRHRCPKCGLRFTTHERPLPQTKSAPETLEEKQGAVSGSGAKAAGGAGAGQPGINPRSSR